MPLINRLTWQRAVRRVGLSQWVYVVRSARMRLRWLSFLPPPGFWLTVSSPSVELEMSDGSWSRKQSVVARCRWRSDIACHRASVCRCLAYAGWRWKSPSANRARSASLSTGRRDWCRDYHWSLTALWSMSTWEWTVERRFSRHVRQRDLCMGCLGARRTEMVARRTGTQRSERRLWRTCGPSVSYTHLTLPTNREV